MIEITLKLFRENPTAAGKPLDERDARDDGKQHIGQSGRLTDFVKGKRIFENPKDQDLRRVLRAPLSQQINTIEGLKGPDKRHRCHEKENWTQQRQRDSEKLFEARSAVKLGRLEIFFRNRL